MKRFRRFAGIAFAIALLSSLTTAHAEVVVLPIAVDGFISRPTPDGAFTLDSESGFALVRIQDEIVNGGRRFEEARTLLEFDLSSIPTGATITGVSLSVYISSSYQIVAEEPKPVSFFGYSGDGTLTLADGDAGVPISLFSGALNNHSERLTTVGLDPTFVQDALNVGAFAGFNLRIGQSAFAGVVIVTEEQNIFLSFTPPALTITYTAPVVSVAAPEPSALALLLLVLMVGGTLAHRRTASK